ncbi:FAD-dependent oxidoreductase, partial [Streptococcus suis]
EAYIERSRASYGNTFNNNGVEVIQCFARFVDNQTVEVNGELIRAKHIVISTGAKPVVPAITGSELGIVSDDVFAWEE